MREAKGVSLRSAASALRTSTLLVPAVAFLTAASVIASSLPAAWPWQTGAAAISLIAGGYTISAIRAFYLGATDLPSVWTTLPTAARRGFLSALVATGPVIAFALTLNLLNIIDAPQTRTVLAGLVLLVGAPFAVVGWAVWIRYVAFDRLREGFRYRAAWRTLRGNARLAARLGCYWLVGVLIIAVLRAASLTLIGLDPLGAQPAWPTLIADGLVARGASLAAITLVTGVASSLWELIAAHMTGQYLMSAHPVESLTASA